MTCLPTGSPSRVRLALLPAAPFSDLVHTREPTDPSELADVSGLNANGLARTQLRSSGHVRKLGSRRLSVSASRFMCASRRPRVISVLY